jgi:1-acyl-sn-glycerol-3-phosphate acyltransferase
MKVNGAENIPSTGGVIFASNHVAGGDPPFVGSAINREVYFLAKKELFRSFILRTLIRSLNAIPVNRGIFDRNALTRAESILNEGYGLILFPEGTRSKTGELGKAKPGTGMLARRARVPVVPVFIQHSRDFLKLPFSGKRLKVNFGLPISPELLERIPDNKEGYRAIAEKVMNEIKALRESSEVPG